MVLVLSVCSIVFFFFGWTQFAVPAGKYGVMLSKSGGYHAEVIRSGSMIWRWERLIPTNAQIFTFDLSPRRINYALDGSLPAADRYMQILNNKDDFSWSFSVDALISIKPEQLVSVVSSRNIRTQEALDSFTDSQIQAAMQSIMHSYITLLLEDAYLYQKVKTDYHAFSEMFKQELEKRIGAQFSIAAVTIAKISVPDLNTYKIAEQAYTQYEQTREMLLAETAAKEAQRAASEQFQIERLAKWGDFLAKYPAILELIAVAQKDSKAALDALRAVEKKEE